MLLLESTYGDRIHEPDDQGARLAAIIKDTVARGGKLIIPAFAIGRVEEVLYWIKKLEDEGKIPKLPVFLDSPMALDALRYYASRAERARPRHPGGAPRFAGSSPLDSNPCRRRSSRPSSCGRRFRRLSSRRAAWRPADGCCITCRPRLPDKRNTVLFVGYQAAGTRGRQLVDGAREVKIRGQFVPVNARIERLDSMSAHADSEETLRWLGGFKKPPSITYLVHGEPGPMDALKSTIESRLHWNVHAPAHLEQVELS